VRFQFRFSTGHRLAALPFGVTPRTAWAELDQGELRVRFGPWRLRTHLANIDGIEESGGYAFVKTAGPAHLSLADRGITFATTGDHGLCLRFVEPARVDFKLGHLRCPGATLTLADPDGFRAALTSGRD
jgi:hypothetical protein